MTPIRSVAALVAAGLAALPAAAQGNAPVATARYVCADNRAIAAKYYGDRVELVLGDGREMRLPQAMSASGARYANADESFVFWNKGRTAFITEGTNQVTTYADCNETPA